jgi:L,D-transpeptidase ErfK/SrfK
MTSRNPAIAACRSRSASLAAVLLLGGCSTFVPREPVPVEPAEPPPPVIESPLATHRFPFDPESTGVVGELQITRARHEDTLSDIARRFSLGYEDVVRANPGVDPWLPGEGTRIVLPTQFVLPDAAPEGIVVNLAALRLFYFPKPGKDGVREVLTYPIGIGKVGWATPEGRTTVVSKRRNPWWTPPASVRREHAAEGDPLPARVPPGPDNPLGAHAMNLGWPSYLIHGTNKPAGVGLRASHGCIRMYPEDIAAVFDRIPVGTKVTVVNQPLLYRWHGDSLYVQSYPPHEEYRKGQETAPAEQAALFNDVISDRIWQKVKEHGGAISWPVTEQVVTEARGVAVPVSRRGISYEVYVASARHVENVLPDGANWDGSDGAEPVSAAAPVAAGTRRH